MKKLFLASLLIITITACSTTSDKETISQGYSLIGEEALAVYSSYTGESPRILYNIAYSHIENNDLEKALDCALEAEKIYPNYLRFYQLEAYCYRELEDIAGYQRALDKILKLSPGNTEVREMLITSYLDQEDEDKVIEEAKTLLQFDSKNETALKALSLYIPFYQELTGYTPDDKALEKAISNMDTRLKLMPELLELGTFRAN